MSKWQVERIRKRYQETGDGHDRPRSGRPRKTTAREDSLLVRLTAPGRVEASGACFVKNCMSDSCSQWSPRSYCCPETSAQQETAKKPCCVRQGPQPDGRLDSRQLDFSDEFAPSQAKPTLSMTLRDPSGPTVHPEDSQIWSWKDYSFEVTGRSVRWITDSATRLTPKSASCIWESQYIPNWGVWFFNRMELLAIPQVPLWSFSGEEDQGPSGMASTVSRYEYYWAYLGKNEGGSLEDQAEELGGALGCLQGGLPCHPRRLHQQALRLSAKPDGNCSAGQRNPYKILIT